jgi:hypothetical protein
MGALAKMMFFSSCYLLQIYSAMITVPIIKTYNAPFQRRAKNVVEDVHFDCSLSTPGLADCGL